MPRFQVHAHTRLDARRSPAPTITHAHAGGHDPHQHAHYGPAFYGHLREKDKFVAKPTGEQLPIVELEDWQKSFEVVVCDPMPSVGQPGYIGDGPGLALPLRIARGFKMPFTVVDGSRGAK